MAVSFNTIPSGNGIMVPLFYAEIDNSAAFTPGNSNVALLFGQMTSDGTAEAEKPVAVSSAAMAKTLFGRGSMLARMVEAYRNTDLLGTLYCIPLADASTGTAATATVTITGTASESGSIFLYVGGDLVRVGVSAKDAATTVATSVAAAVNAKGDLPVTAAAASGVVTLTARNKGTLGNKILIRKNVKGLIGGESDIQGLGVEIETMSGGATDPDIEDAVKAMGSEAYEYIGVPYADATTMNLFQDVMNDTSGRWGPYQMLYGHVFYTKRGTFNDLLTYGKTRNDQHATTFGLESTFGSWDVEALASLVARTKVFIDADPARPTQTGSLIGITGAPVGERFELTERNTLLQNGIATQTVVSGVVQIERSVTNYRVNKYGEQDLSYVDCETLFTSAYVMRYLKGVITSKYGRTKLANDGTNFGPGQAIVTPGIIRAELTVAYAKLEYEGIVENSALFDKYLVVERDTNNVNRVNVLFPPDYVNQLRIFALQNQFRLQYSEE
ncbi:MAG: phage tail sheath subtilisin-like domain-containing protein [Burkholderiales bacterium]|nr:phage tail sheath subtilisin-like domain-containing protein [Burkholderiales bacterium]